MKRISTVEYLKALRIVENYLEQQGKLILNEKDKIVNQELSLRLLNCLKCKVDNIQEITVEEFFKKYSEQDFLCWRNLGKKSLGELFNLAEKYNIKVKPFEPYKS